MALIELTNVSVEYPIYNVNSRSLKKKFLRMTTGGSVSADANQRLLVTAINNLTLTFRDGDRIGLIGHNGAGKSTLLRLLAQVYEPTQGYMHVEGKISAITDIMLGIQHEFTGYENIYYRGLILGLSKKTIKDKIDDIAEFSGLGDYLSMPTRTYSSGMLVRLAFAISTSVKPEILLIDEVFAAGDANFMAKAQKRMIELLEKSSIVVMANHSEDIITQFCNKILLLDNGSIKFFGRLEEAKEKNIIH